MNTKTCPTCHSIIPANAPGGFCPACILRDADDAPLSGRRAPSLAEVSAAFPQLEIIALIGQGGMGFVYQVRQPALDRTVALKILSPELGRDPAFAERFAREARVLGKLNHPNIVTVFESGESGGFFYLLMEFVDGVNLRQAMRAGRFTPQQALGVVPGICDALQAAHAQGVWHRDIKPENILLDAQGRVKIVDFGIARLVGDPERNFTLTRTGGQLGSAAYMAPEQHEKPHDVDHRADIYSLGVVIYEMLTGELPLGRFPAPSAKAAVDARIDEIVFRTLEKEREMRQQSADEVKTEVANAGRGGPRTAQRIEDPSVSTLRQASKIALVGGPALFLSAVFLTQGIPQSVILTIAATAFLLGLVGVLFGGGSAKVGRSEPPARLVFRSVWIFVVGLLLLGAGLFQYNNPEELTRMINLDGRDIFAPRSPERMLGIYLVWIGGLCAVAGWLGSLHALWLMRRGHIQPIWRGRTRVCAWLPVVAMLIAALTFMRFKRSREIALGEMVAMQQIAENERQKQMEEQTAMAEAKEKLASLKLEFPDLSTPQGAVVAYHSALDARDQKGVLAAIPQAVADSALVPNEYANELIALNESDKIFKEDVSLLTAVMASTQRTQTRAMDEPSRKRILGREPGEVRFVDYKTRHLGKNPAVAGGTEVCVQEGTGWRVIPRVGPSLKVSQKPTPAVRTGKLITSEKIENGVRTVERKFVTDTGEVFPSVEAADQALRHQQNNPEPLAPLPLAESPLQVLRKLNTFANESNGEEFKKHMTESVLSTNPSELMSRHGAKFTGRITMLKVVGFEKETATNSATMTVFAALQNPDGGTAYQNFQFHLNSGAWKYAGTNSPLFRAVGRIQFRPESGNASDILRRHFDKQIAFQSVTGSDALFDVETHDVVPETARNRIVNDFKTLRESLAKEGLDKALTVIAEPETPAVPVSAESPKLRITVFHNLIEVEGRRMDYDELIALMREVERDTDRTQNFTLDFDFCSPEFLLKVREGIMGIGIRLKHKDGRSVGGFPAPGSGGRSNDALEPMVAPAKSAMPAGVETPSPVPASNSQNAPVPAAAPSSPETPAPAAGASWKSVNPVPEQIQSSEPLELIYKMNELASVKNVAEFRKYLPSKSLPKQPSSDEEISIHMGAFAEKIAGVWKDLPVHLPVDPYSYRVGPAPRPRTPGFALAVGPNAKLGPSEKQYIVEFERTDGSHEYRAVVFDYLQTGWGFSHMELLPYRAKTRVEFRPAEGDPKAILMKFTSSEQVTQVFANGEAVPGLFDIRGAYKESADGAVKSVNQIIERITLSLKNAGSESSLKIVSPATAPEKPEFFSIPGITSVTKAVVTTQGQSQWYKSSSLVSFAPVVERVLAFADKEKEQGTYIDFETGKVVEGKLLVVRFGDKRDTSVKEWIQSSGVDAVAGHPMLEIEGFPPRLWIAEGKLMFFYVKKGESFETLRAEDAAASTAQVTEQSAAAFAQPSDPYWFKTTTGTMGVVQILGRTEDGKGMKIRYKLVVDPMAPIDKKP